VHAPPKNKAPPAMLLGHNAVSPPALCVPPAAPPAAESVTGPFAPVSALAAAVPEVLLAEPAAALDAANAGEVICCAKIVAVVANIPAIARATTIVVFIAKYLKVYYKRILLQM
jgi:hypothetical protein